jgi:hypothetical protein
MTMENTTTEPEAENAEIDERDSAKGHQVRPEKSKKDSAISFSPVAS